MIQLDLQDPPDFTDCQFGALDMDKMSAEHTPGPWHWDSDPVKNDPLKRVRFRVVAIGKTITQTYYTNLSGGELTNAEADARLIAAAPDLLDALEQLLAAETKPAGFSMSMAANREHFDRFLAECGEKVDAARAAARAAITKATGRPA